MLTEFHSSRVRKRTPTYFFASSEFTTSNNPKPTLKGGMLIKAWNDSSCFLEASEVSIQSVGQQQLVTLGSPFPIFKRLSWMLHVQ